MTPDFGIHCRYCLRPLTSDQRCGCPRRPAGSGLHRGLGGSGPTDEQAESADFGEVTEADFFDVEPLWHDSPSR